MMSPMSMLRRAKEARIEAAKRLAENPEDSSSGKKCKQLYKIGDMLGKGAFSIVKEGTHKQSGKSYAIKIVNTYRLTEQDRAALRDEISILQDFGDSHTGLMQLYDVFDGGGDYCYLVTEKFMGGSLYERIAQKGCYSEEEGRLACRNLFQGVAYTHKNCVAHRDLKLENLLLTNMKDDCDIKIIDFGFAKRVTSANGLHTFIGTPGYVAPCILEGNGYGTQADIWSVGVIVYCMLGGSPPFVDKNRDKLFRKISKGSYEYHEAKWGHVSSDAKDLIDRLLTVDPTKRITAEEALDHRWLNWEEEKDYFRSQKTASPVSTLETPELVSI